MSIKYKLIAHTFYQYDHHATVSSMMKYSLLPSTLTIFSCFICLLYELLLIILFSFSLVFLSSHLFVFTVLAVIYYEQSDYSHVNSIGSLHLFCHRRLQYCHRCSKQISVCVCVCVSITSKLLGWKYHSNYFDSIITSTSSSISVS